MSEPILFKTTVEIWTDTDPRMWDRPLSAYIDDGTRVLNSCQKETRTETVYATKKHHLPTKVRKFFGIDLPSCSHPNAWKTRGRHGSDKGDRYVFCTPCNGNWDEDTGPVQIPEIWARLWPGS